MDPVLEMQGVLITRLKGYTALSALVGQKIYDQPPADQNGTVPAATYPYVSMGPSNFVSEDADCISGGDFMIQIDAWSLGPGFVEVRKVADAVRKAVRGHSFTLTINALVEFEHWRTDYVRDGSLFHASIRFTGIVEQP